jgi:kanamycin kinase
LQGRSAVDPVWVADPRTAVRAIGAGLRLLHDALPVDGFAFGPPPWVTEQGPVDRLVVCHGDACAPNTLIGDNGRCCGHVDLGDLGIADRWADIAVAMLSLAWNYSGSWEGELLDAYGVDADPARIEAFQRLWNAGDISSH